ncbi:calponin homology domain-containing protein [Brachionus plicatilis]|uniref:Calponin homology domain-containing protein n=1 Tax=Brachionus plicatilis TaxID=10195 RepID=A0A3M7S4E4_BRAPC|nr:calponin homology domain-containing protein [Brachionus plicatilis]
MLSNSLAKSSQFFSSSHGDKGTNSQIRLMTGTLSQLVSKSKILGSQEIIAENTLTSLNSKNFDTYLPSISDQLKVGFYSTDRCTQTDESEIIVLKAATENLDYLCSEINRVKSDLKFAKNSSDNQFNQELNNKSIEIYQTINTKISELLSNQEQILERIRHAYKSKLANAISYFQKLSDDQKRYFVTEIEKLNEKLKKKSTTSNSSELIRELQRKIAEQEITIKKLTDEFRETIENNNIENDRKIEELEAEKTSFQENNVNQQKRIHRLEEALNIKEEETERLNSDITNLQTQIENEKIHNEEISKEFHEFRVKSEQEKNKMKKEFEKQKIAMETKFNEKMKESTEQIMHAAKQELKQQQMLQKQQENELMEERKRQEEEYQEMLRQQQEALERERIEKDKELERMKKNKKMEEENMRKEQLSIAESIQRDKERELSFAKSAANRDNELISKLKSNETYLKSEINRLKREVHRNNETWEKKFDILKDSLHAIKHEMYLRQSLQKQSAHLAYASVAYTMNQAPSLQQQFQQTNDARISTKTVLPSINSARNSEPKPSLSITVPSRLSGNLDQDENQIVDELEMYQLKEEYFDDVELIQTK